MSSETRYDFFSKKTEILSVICASQWASTASANESKALPPITAFRLLMALLFYVDSCVAEGTLLDRFNEFIL